MSPARRLMPRGGCHEDHAKTVPAAGRLVVAAAAVSASKGAALSAKGQPSRRAPVEQRQALGNGNRFREVPGKGCTDCIQACNTAHNIPHIPDPAHEVKWIWKEPYERFSRTARIGYARASLACSQPCRCCATTAPIRLHARLPDAGHLEARGRHGDDGLAPLHRLPVLHGRLPVWFAQLQLAIRGRTSPRSIRIFPRAPKASWKSATSARSGWQKGKSRPASRLARKGLYFSAIWLTRNSRRATVAVALCHAAAAGARHRPVGLLPDLDAHVHARKSADRQPPLLALDDAASVLIVGSGFLFLFAATRTRAWRSPG